MSDKQTVSSSSTEGKSVTIVTEATQPQPAIAVTTNVAEANVAPVVSDEDIFVLAGKLEALLKGKSNKTCLKLMNMVGSLHGIRCIPSDRPIGQSTVGTTKVVPTAAKPKKGQSTPPAAWKQTDAYKRLSAERVRIVTTIKSLSPDELSNKTVLVEELRATEQKLKALKSPTAGDH